MDTLTRTLQGQEMSEGEANATLEINQILADPCVHIYWTVTGKDLEYSSNTGP